MRVGWRHFIKQKLFSADPDHAVGVVYAADSVSFCALRREGDSLHFLGEKTVAHAQWHQQLDTWMQELSLPVCRCNLTFSVDWHTLMQVDRPNVEDNEVHDALAWSIRDLMGSDEPHVYDYTDLPVPLAGTQKVNVFALPQAQLATASDALLGSRCRLIRVSVAELSLCNLLAPTSEAVLTLSQESGEEVVLNVVKNGALYFSRRLKGFENIGSFSEEELNMGLIDSLSVQVQRTLDYFESQLRQPPIRTVLVNLDTHHNALVAQLIKQAVPVTVEPLTPAVTFARRNRVNLVCLGAAMELLTPDTDLVRESA